MFIIITNYLNNYSLTSCANETSSARYQICAALKLCQGNGSPDSSQDQRLGQICQVLGIHAKQSDQSGNKSRLLYN